MDGNLVDYDFFLSHYWLITIDLSNRTGLENPDLKQQISCIGRLEENATVLFIIEKKRRNNF